VENLFPAAGFSCTGIDCHIDTGCPIVTAAGNCLAGNMNRAAYLADNRNPDGSIDFGVAVVAATAAGSDSNSDRSSRMTENPPVLASLK